MIEMDKSKQTFFLATAKASEPNVFARNYVVKSIRGMSNTGTQIRTNIYIEMWSLHALYKLITKKDCLY